MNEIELLDVEYVEAEEVEQEPEQEAEELGSIPIYFERSEQHKLILDDSLFIGSLENAGFFTVRKNGETALVQIRANIIKKIFPDDIKRYVLNDTEQYFDREIKNFFIRNTKYFTINYLSALRRVEPQILRDTKDIAYFYYTNGVVQVTKERIYDPVSYVSFGYLVWEEHILPREYIIKQDWNESSFPKFVFRLANNNEERYYYLCSIIGYALHNYRTNDNTRAIIINDENINEHPEGGSGKSLLAKSLGQLRNLVIKDGKTFNPRRSFEYSNIDETTDLVLIDETSENFSFQDLFSVITEGIEIEQKFKNKRRLSIEDTPLFLITTNTVVKGFGGSNKRRQYNVDIHQHFNYHHTPKDEFGKRFFTEWDKEEWLNFDNFMLYCVWLKLNREIMHYSNEVNVIKEAVRATNQTFYEWFEEVKYDFQNKTSTKEALNRYQEETGENLSPRKFIGFIKHCAQIFGYEFIQERTPNERGFRLVLN
ncbi:MAG: hypothetical protein K0B37_08590 [Bacteroidales bacterium]|nr:hypothetical protein [Bacteroidales bacterium]